MVAQPQTGRHGPQLDARPPRRDTAGTQPVCAPVKLSRFQHPARTAGGTGDQPVPAVKGVIKEVSPGKTVSSTLPALRRVQVVMR